MVRLKALWEMVAFMVRDSLFVSKTAKIQHVNSLVTII